MRRIRLAAASVVVAAGLIGAIAAQASATTETFNRGTHQTWTVPEGVTEATFDLYGAQGGFPRTGVTDPRLAPGLGGRATATIGVTPGESIQVNVGGHGLLWGGRATPGGVNGGGDSAASGGGSGGGASDVRTGDFGLDDRVLVAGGGGGAGDEACFSFIGWAGGAGGGASGLDGQPAIPENVCGPGLFGGDGGTQDELGGSAEPPATDGTFGFGGDGDPTFPGGFSGGGGGGGWYGGGGGFQGGGGGGSGHGPDGTTFATGVREGDGLVTITYTEPTTSDLIDSVEALNLPSGTEKSLLQKLNGAQKDLNGGNTGGACDKLASFISQVKALKGKKIVPASAADDLVDEATAVRASIGCG
jgi:hypothetical protein